MVYLNFYPMCAFSTPLSVNVSSCCIFPNLKKYRTTFRTNFEIYIDQIKLEKKGMLNDIFETYVVVDDTPADLNTEITTARHRKPTQTQTVHMF